MNPLERAARRFELLATKARQSGMAAVALAHQDDADYCRNLSRATLTFRDDRWGGRTGPQLSKDARDRLNAIAGSIEAAVKDGSLHRDFGARDARFLRALAEGGKP